MLQNIYSCERAITRLRTGPGGTHLDGFVDWLTSQDYRLATIRTYVSASVDFAAWARHVGRADEVLDQNALNDYRTKLVEQGRWVQGYGKSSIYYTGARRFVAYLQHNGVVAPVRDCSDARLDGFRAWLLQQRGLAPLTVHSYLTLVGQLIAALGPDPHQYDATSLRTFVLDKASRHSRSTAKNLVTAVRNYLRFLIARGTCPPGLDAAVPRIAGWQLSTLPRYLEPHEVERVLEACPADTSASTRDRAILLLLARLALRAGEVATLHLGDIDWDAGQLRVCGKVRRQSLLPLPQEVGDAVLAYLDKARRTTQSDAVFLNARAPYRPITSHTVSQIARRAILRSGVEAPSLGAHLFRHSAATTLLRKGAALRDISALLRHDSVESTVYYAKVDLDTLKSIARPWPGRSTC